MSIEQALAENTKAVLALVDISTQLLNVRQDAIEKVAAVAKPATTKKADDKLKPNISASPEDRKENPFEGMKEAIAGYLGGDDMRPEEREARKGKIKALLNHEKIKKADHQGDATKAEHIMESAVPLFLDQIAKLTAKGDLTEPKAAADDLL